MALNLSGTSGITGAGIGTIGPSGANITGVGTFTQVEIDDKIVHVGDTNTAIRFPAADTVTVETGGSERARIDSAGRLMLATTSTSGISGSADDIIIGSIGDSTSRGITFATTADGTIRWADSGDNAMGRIQYLNNTDIMSFHTANATRLQISATGKISIGGASNEPPGTPDGNLHIQDGSAGSVTASTVGNLAVFEDSASNGISILVPAAERANIYFGTPGTGGEIEAGIQYAHESVSTTADRRDMIFRAGGGEKVRIQGTGGISFNGDNTDANALDDYEEGAWTPAYNSNSNGGSFPVSTYIRIGRLVHLSLRAEVGGGNDTSGFKITGMPFAPDKNGAAAVGTDCNIACWCRIYDSATHLEVHKFDDSDVTYQNLSDKFIAINVTYRCNP